MTNLDAPRRRIAAIDLEAPGNLRAVVAESDNTLVSVGLVGGKLVAEYLQDARTQVKLYDLDGAHVRDVELPGIGSASGFSGEQDDSETFYYFSSFATPPSIYHYDLESGEGELMRQAEVDFEPTEYVVKQVFYTSKDGTQVPMFIAHREGLELDGTNPTLLYG